MDIRGLDDATLLATQERSAVLPRPWRELELLAAAAGEAPERLARLPIGDRDRALLALRERTFGQLFDGEVDCPACGTRLEFTLDVAALRLPPPTIAPGGLEVDIDEGEPINVRLPDSLDVAAAIDAGLVGEEPATVIATRCASGFDGVAHGAPLGAATVAAIGARLAEIDPQAELLLDLDCPSCGNTWQDMFDPGAVLLGEVDARVETLLEEVHLLARAYGWREVDVLAIGPRRRRRYLDLAAG